MNPFATILATFLICIGQIAVAGAPTNAPFDSLVLLDVQGLWGGQNLWLHGDGSAVVQLVTSPTKKGQSGLQEQRFAVRFTDIQITALCKLLDEQSFPTIRPPDRPGVPDEADPVIWMRSKSGACAAAMKLADDKHKAFDAVYQHLLKLVKEGKKGHLNYKGNFDWDWRPEGFSRWQEMYNLAVKDSKIHKQIKDK